MHDPFISRREALSLALAAAGTLVLPKRAAGLVTAAEQTVAGQASPDRGWSSAMHGPSTRSRRSTR